MMFCPENGELALLRRVRQKSAAPCRMRLSGRREARPSPAAETPGGRFFVSILKMNFIVNIRTDRFLPPLLFPGAGTAHGRERFPFQRVTCEAATPRRPAQNERKKTRFFRETTGRMAERTKHFKQHMLSTKNAPCRPASSPAPEALRHGRSASGKSLPRRLSAQYKSCFSRAASLRCWSQRRLFVHGAAPFLRGKKPRRSIRRRENAGAYPLGRTGRCSIPSNEGAMFSTLQHIHLL